VREQLAEMCQLLSHAPGVSRGERKPRPAGLTPTGRAHILSETAHGGAEEGGLGGGGGGGEEGAGGGTGGGVEGAADGAPQHRVSRRTDMSDRLGAVGGAAAPAPTPSTPSSSRDAISAARHLCLKPMEAGGGLTAPDLLLSRRRDAERSGCGGEEERAEDTGTDVLRGGASRTARHSSKRLADVRKDVVQLEEKLVSPSARFEAVSPRGCGVGDGRERQTGDQLGECGDEGGDRGGAEKDVPSLATEAGLGNGRWQAHGDGDTASGEEFVLECSDFDEVGPGPGDEMELCFPSGGTLGFPIPQDSEAMSAFPSK